MGRIQVAELRAFATALFSTAGMEDEKAAVVAELALGG